MVLFLLWGLREKMVILLQEKLPELVVIHNTARCGSTLLCQMLNNLPKTRVVSEPFSYLVLHGMRRQGKLSEDQFGEIVKSMTLMSLKSNSGRAHNNKI